MQDPELVNQLKERLPEALFEKLNGSLSIDRDRLKFAEYKVRVLKERLRLVRIEKYGPGSEKLSDAQLELLELEPGVSSAEVEAESERAQLKLPLKQPRKHPGRQELPAHLPRIEKIQAEATGGGPKGSIGGHAEHSTQYRGVFTIGIETGQDHGSGPDLY